MGLMIIKKTKGITLIELICVIAIMGIVGSIMYPSLKDLESGNQLSLQTDIMVNDLRYAKMYAVSRNITSVYVRFTGNGSIDSYTGYKIYYPNNLVNVTLKVVTFYNRVIVDGLNSTFSTKSAKDLLEFYSSGNVYPVCSIIMKDTETGRTKKITLTTDYTRIMEVE